MTTSLNSEALLITLHKKESILNSSGEIYVPIFLHFCPDQRIKYSHKWEEFL